MRRCWTCNTEHEMDAPCGANQTVRNQRMEGRPGFTIVERTADLFDDAPNHRLGPVFTATYETEDACCGEGIYPGEDIRADGRGGWIHADDDCERLARK